MATLIGYSADFLKDNREVLFFEGQHYFPKNKRINWKVTEMINWVENQTISDKAKEILDLVI